MVLAVGASLPSGSFNTSVEGKLVVKSTEDVFSGKKVVLFAVPGAFTPTCTNDHCPGFRNMANQLQAAGVDTVACLAVNDTFVLTAWANSLNVDGKILMLADGNADWTKAAGMEVDLATYGLGIRCKRFALVAEDGKITFLGIDDAGLEKSSVESVLDFLTKK